jgi:peptidoglycan/LPS O-acetylase OafA/YrhL
MQTNPLSSKAHFPILDGLRGVAAVMVVAFHIFEANAPNRFEQIINHGYLAVDFFFLLSGFVIGYAYDDRWNKMTAGDFYKRRLVRLQPMVVMGMVVGAVCFYFQDSTIWPGISEVPVWKMLLVMLVGCTLIPLPPSMDIRGWNEMHPLDGPGWSLFFEYIGNFLYAVAVRKFSNLLLGILVFISGAFLVHYLVMGPNGDVIGGWSLDSVQIPIGFMRMMYPFFAGLLLFRVFKIIPVKNAFLLCSALVIIVLALPRFGDKDHLWMNGIYESIAILFIFPLIVFLGAGGTVKGKFATTLCKFFGDISYPIYITHYPIIYIYTAWVINHKVPLEKAWPYGIIVMVSSILLAYGCLKLYDEPVRAWLKDKIMPGKNKLTVKEVTNQVL